MPLRMVSDRNWALPTGAEDVAAAKAAVSIVQLANQQGWLDKLKDLFKTKHKVIL
jgi:hypothetical protein